MAGEYNFTGNRFGKDNAGNDQRGLMLKVWSGEVLDLWTQNCLMQNLVNVRNVGKGVSSAKFPLYGSGAAVYHTPGANLLEAASSYLNNFKFSERTITLDNMLVAPTVVHDIDELLTFWDQRSRVTKELVEALAIKFDKTAIYTMIAASFGTNPISQTSRNGTALSGEAITTATAGSVTGAQLLEALRSAQIKLDNKDVPASGRFCILRPEQYSDLVSAATGGGLASYPAVFSRDYGSGVGDPAKGTAGPLNVYGFNIYKVNWSPRDVDLSADTTWTGSYNSNGSGNVQNDPFGSSGVGYGADLSDIFGVCGHGDAVGCITRMETTIETQRKTELQGDLIVAKKVFGMNVLRPECAIRLAWTAG